MKRFGIYTRYDATLHLADGIHFVKRSVRNGMTHTVQHLQGGSEVYPGHASDLSKHLTDLVWSFDKPQTIETLAVLSKERQKKEGEQTLKAEQDKREKEAAKLRKKADRAGAPGLSPEHIEPEVEEVPEEVNPLAAFQQQNHLTDANPRTSKKRRPTVSNSHEDRQCGEGSKKQRGMQHNTTAVKRIRSEFAGNVTDASVNRIARLPASMAHLNEPQF